MTLSASVHPPGEVHIIVVELTYFALTVFGGI